MDQQYLNSDKAIRLFLLLGLVALSVLTTDAQEDPDSLEVVYVRGNIYMLKGPGGNVALSLGRDGTLLVDSKFANLADEIRAVIDSLHGGKIGVVMKDFGRQNFRLETQGC